MTNKLSMYKVVLLSCLLLLSSIITGFFVVIPYAASLEDKTLQKNTLEEQGLDPDQIQRVINTIKENQWHIDSMVIIRNNYFVFEKHLSLEAHMNHLIQDRNVNHIIASCTKSVMSTLIGIAVTEGYLDNVSQKMLDFFPNRNIKNINDLKEEITLQDLLTMRSGMIWDNKILNQMTNAPDFTQFVLNLPVIRKPGTGWCYSEGDAHLVANILQKATQMNPMEFAQKKLFRPLNIQCNYWSKSPEGVNRGGGGLQLSPVDMAKLGLLYLNNGSWDGKQIIAADYIKDALTSHHYFTTNKNGPGYGYFWWTDALPDGLYPNISYARGHYGQYIFLIPKYDMVVVFTANMEPYHPHLELLQMVLEAVEA